MFSCTYLFPLRQYGMLTVAFYMWVCVYKTRFQVSILRSNWHYYYTCLWLWISLKYWAVKWYETTVSNNLRSSRYNLGLVTLSVLGRESRTRGMNLKLRLYSLTRILAYGVMTLLLKRSDLFSWFWKRLFIILCEFKDCHSASIQHHRSPPITTVSV